ncbi:MAG TPA: phosphoribosylaminoimidazolesuccinocarboxamide synthase [Chthoniobacterales bacterium]|jgi:phosphoribosylaminoimidazole-succinocarboxamide synthase
MNLLTCDLPGIQKLRSGKVREVFDLGEQLLIVTTDRISAFDCVFPDPIPGKGEVLTQLSRWWFQQFPNIPNHFISAEVDEYPAELQPYRDVLARRSMLVQKTQPLPVECVVRGYLAGSGWKEYQICRTVGGHAAPMGMQNADILPAPLFTPSTKADEGHDENITWLQCVEILGANIAQKVRDYSLALYTRGRDIAAEKGIIIADTKFEFGMLGDEVILIDECLTPDSSRFWPADSYRAGSNPPSYDKQFVRDYLETLDWDKTPPAPSLPADVIEKTAQKYREAFERLTA